MAERRRINLNSTVNSKRNAVQPQNYQLHLQPQQNPKVIINHKNHYATLMTETKRRAELKQKPVVISPEIPQVSELIGALKVVQHNSPTQAHENTG